jgi:hypothetical protein
MTYQIRFYGNLRPSRGVERFEALIAHILCPS